MSTDRNGQFFSKLAVLLEEFGVEIHSYGEGQGSEGSIISFEGEDVEYEFQDDTTFEGIVTAEYCRNNFIF